MPRRNVLSLLPPALLREIDARIVTSGFFRYDEHAAWLASQGYPVSRSAVARHGKRLKTAITSNAGLIEVLKAWRSVLDAAIAALGVSVPAEFAWRQDEESSRSREGERCETGQRET